MTQTLSAIALIAAPVMCAALVIYILVRTILDFAHTGSGRFRVVLKALASLAAWFLASCGWLYLFFAMAYWTGSFVDVDGELGEALSLLLLDLAYAAIGLGLAFWIRRRPDRRA
jgi:hypothetical protein